MTKPTLKTSLLGMTLALAIIGFTYGLSRADTYGGTYTQNTSWRHRHHRRGGFMLGICVGETLAQQGITLPAPTPGQRPTLDPTTQQAIQAAAQSCIAQFRGTQPSPTPSPSESTAPSNGS